jgi:ribosome-associated protein
MIEITTTLQIPEEELEFSAARSGGPGGQNVNKVATKVTLRFDVARSPSLPPEVRERLQAKLASRLTKDGVLQVSVQDTRSQKTNRDRAVERFVALLQAALRPEKPRRKTRVPTSVKRERLDSKRRRSGVKSARRKPAQEE